MQNKASPGVLAGLPQLGSIKMCKLFGHCHDSEYANTIPK